MKLNMFSIIIITVILMISSYVGGEDRAISPEEMVKGRAFDINNIFISNVRFFVLPNSRKEQAMNILAGKSFYKLNMDEFFLLTDKKNFDASKLLQLEIEKAEKYRAYAERMSDRFPHSKRYKDAIESHKNYISYMRNVKCGLIPYLVRAKQYSPHTGEYSIFLRGDILDVTHLSMGKNLTDLNDELLIIFLERELKDVYIDALLAS